MLEIRDITSSNLPDAARLCLAGKTLSDRPKAFTRDIELDSTRCKLSALREQMAAGAKAHAAYRDGMLVGYLEYHPIERALAPLEGEGCHVIQCVRVPETAERAEVEVALVEHAVKTVPASRGLAVLAREKEWTSCGFTDPAREAAEVQGFERVLWWRQIAPGDAPKIAPVDRKLPRIPGKVRVDLFFADRCPWDKYVFDMVRSVCARMKGEVVLYETDCNKRRNVLRAGVTCGVAVNGQFQSWVRPYRLPDEHMIRRTLDDAV
jgi:hypothetical protein